MSLDITLEADDRLTRDQIKAALAASGASHPEDHQWGFKAVFPVSGMPFHYQDAGLGASSVILTTGMENAGWKFGSRSRLGYVHSRSKECDAQLAAFLEGLAERTEACFVVAYELETLIAIRDAQGLRFV
jgi:hypothetical protein